LARGLEAINEVRLSAVTRRLGVRLDAAATLGVTLAPPTAVRKRRGQEAYGLTKAFQDADGAHPPPPALLPWLDGFCYRCAQGTSGVPYLSSSDLATATPLLNRDQAVLIGILYRLSQHQGRLIKPYTEDEQLIASIWGSAFVDDPSFHEPVWSDSRRLEGWRNFLLEFAPRVTDPTVKSVVRALLRRPDRIAKIRQCDFASCFRFFVDRSPTWATAPARGCPGSTHTVRLHKLEAPTPTE
jgi:hypothetical protein